VPCTPIAERRSPRDGTKPRQTSLTATSKALTEPEWNVAQRNSRQHDGLVEGMVLVEGKRSRPDTMVGDNLLVLGKLATPARKLSS
jgi:hypothetical protein